MLDDSRAPLGAAAARTSGDDEWDVLVLGASDLLFRHRRAAELERLGRWRILPVGDLASRAREVVAGAVVEVVRDLPDREVGGRSLRDLLGELWWYLETTEKSPFRGRLVDQLYRLAILDAVVGRTDYDEIWLSLRDHALADVVTRSWNDRPIVRIRTEAAWRSTSLRTLIGRYVIDLAREAASAALLALISRTMRWPRGPRNGLLCISSYPYFWLSPFSPAPTERFLPELPEDPPSAYAVWLSGPAEILKHRAGVERAARSKQLVPLQRYLRPAAFARLLSPRPFRALLATRGWTPDIRFLGRDVGPLIADDLRLSLTSTTLFHAQLIRDAARECARALRPRAVLYRVEHQPWEHAVLHGLRGAPTVGFRHSAFGPAYLPMRFADGELAGALAARGEADAMPLPDRMLVTGPIGVDPLVAAGFPRDRIAVCGPQRHPGLATARRHGKPASAKGLYVALSIVPADTEAMLSALADASEAIPGLSLKIRGHPSRAPEAGALRALLEELGLAAYAVPAGDDLHGEIARSEAVLLVGSTLAFEAIAFGVMPIVYENSGTYAATTLAEHEDALYVVRDGASLRAALTEVLEGGAGARAKREAWPATLAKVFGDLDRPADELLRDALRRLGILAVPASATGDASPPE